VARVVIDTNIMFSAPIAYGKSGAVTVLSANHWVVSSEPMIE
jgi:predicted nucleic acid-binding protein